MIRAVRLLTPDEVHDSVDCTFADGVITHLEPGGTALAPTDNIVDGRGCTLLPGLIDAHVHADEYGLRMAPQFGVTTVIDMFSDPAQLQSLAALSAHGVGASCVSAGTGATVPGGHPTGLVARGLLAPFPTLSRPQEARAFVRDRVGEGSAFLKVILEDGSSTGTSMPRLDDTVVRELVREAHLEGIQVVAHATSRYLARRALSLGVDGLAHIFADAPADERFVEAAHRWGGFVIPTLTAVAGMFGPAPSHGLLQDPCFGPRLDAKATRLLNARPPARVRRMGAVGVAENTVGRLHEAGVLILAGTDAPTLGSAPGVSIHDELVRLTKAGLSAMQAVRAATATIAEAFKLRDRGVIGIGRRADLLLVAGRPDHDIRATREVRRVWLAGVPQGAVGPGTERPATTPFGYLE